MRRCLLALAVLKLQIFCCLGSSLKAPAALPSQSGLTGIGESERFEHISLLSLPGYQIRLRSPQNLCDPSVKQYSGYLDLSKEKHIFFWFFESRHNPRDAPVVAWMNGGPAGSSGIGLLMENGPCTIQPGGNHTKLNPHSWNQVANMIYLDQPVGVGYSSSTSPNPVQTTWEAAHDFHAFTQLFFSRFPEYSKLPFHIAAESHGGQYAPNFAAYVNRQNQRSSPPHVRVNLDSIIIINGMMSAEIQATTNAEYACRGPYAFWDNEGEQCALLRSRVPILKRVMQECKDFQTRLTCIPAGIYALTAFEDRFEELGLNVYGVRKSCSKGLACYDQLAWIQNYLNKADVKAALGVPTNHTYSLISWKVNRAFMRAADVTNDASSMASELTASGIRILNVAGDADFVCNFMGSFEWISRLRSPHQFQSLNNTIWRDAKDRVVGEVRAAGGNRGATSGKLTWLRVYHAGHMVPHDQPEVALNFFSRWIHNDPIA